MVFGSSKKSDKKVSDFTGFSYETNSPVVEEKPASYVGKTMKIEGKLFSEENLIIEGQVKGTIEVNQTLTIGRNGDIIADIQANVVKISGKVRGNITASEKVAILAEGNFNGNIKSQKLVVAEGAILMGNVNKEETGSESEPAPENSPEYQPGKKNSSKLDKKNKNKAHQPSSSKSSLESEKEEPGYEKEEPEVIEAEIE
ncbi:MAG: polymer-forming cytoskeletal protein [Acidobacteria bacterium]|jgi:cytoskeletal protein CcmA (bactofilin family)|nr:polymer-forming cytoskeletal protein [Acidobacteriota bacterium]